MGSSWVVFVEGKSDKAFVRCLLGFLDINNVQIRPLGGGIGELEAMAPEMQRRRDAGNRVAIILDANSEPENRRKEFEQEKTRLKLPIECEFFLPNDDEPGRLETLLEQIAPPAHRKIYNCLDAYKSCLGDLDEAYITPNPKARIYAYCEAIGAETRPDKKYDDPAHWDLNAPALDPLKQFLRDLT